MSDKVKCKEFPEFRYTWAGQDESFCCFRHGQGIRNVAQAIGYHIQLIELSEDEMVKVSCQSEDPAN